MKRTVHIDANVQWRAFRGASGAWVGVCDPLNLTVQGDTYQEMVRALEEATSLLLEDLSVEGDLQAFLTRLGWTPDGPLPMPGDDVHFDLPYSMDVTRGPDDSRRSAA